MSGDEGDAASGCPISGSWFPSSIPSAPYDCWLICICRQGFYREAHSPPIFDTVHATKLRCRGSPRPGFTVTSSLSRRSQEDGDQSSTSHFSISSTDSLIPAQQGGYAHTWQIQLGLFASTEKMVPLGWLHSRHWDFNALTSNLWISLFPTAEEDVQWWTSAHNVLRVAPVTPTEPDTQLFTDALNIGWGPHSNALTAPSVWTTTKKTLHINMLDLEAIHRAMLHWLWNLMGLTVLVASVEHGQYSCADGPRGYSSCVRTTR